jgi:Tc5 transposase DNA-binding domain
MRGPQWVQLEDALFRWWQETQPRDVIGKELKVKAAELWPTLPASNGKRVPSFSDGWLNSWRARHGLAQPRGTKVCKQIGFCKRPLSLGEKEDGIAVAYPNAASDVGECWLFLNKFTK